MDQCNLGGLEPPSIDFSKADCSATGKHAKISNETPILQVISAS
jgi:hypothetical protein